VRFGQFYCEEEANISRPVVCIQWWAGLLDWYILLFLDLRLSRWIRRKVVMGGSYRLWGNNRRFDLT